MIHKTKSIKAVERLDWLDALRGLAILGVVLTHVGQALHMSGTFAAVTSAGRYGVQLFFIVSAITISITFESHLRKFGNNVATSVSWYVKRFFRIAPLYSAAILFYICEKLAIYVLSHHRYGSPIPPVGDILANVFYVHTWIPSANNSVVPGGWSIGVEMFFYLLVPLIWSLEDDRRRLSALGGAVGVSMAISMVVSYLTTHSLSMAVDSYLYCWFPTQAPVFAIGIGYYLLVMKRCVTLGERLKNALFLVAVVLFAVAVAFGTGMEIFPVVSPLVSSIAFVCLAASVGAKAIKGIFVNTVTLFLGRASYSIYIFHFFVLDAFRALTFSGADNNHHSVYMLLMVFPGSVLVTSVIAFLSKRLIEDPGIRLGRALSEQILMHKTV